MSDLISRQKVLATLDFADKALDEERTIENYKKLLTDCVEVLPPTENKSRLEEINDTRNTLWNRGVSYITEDYLSEISETLAMMYDKMNEKKTTAESDSENPNKCGEWIRTRTWEHDGELYCSKCGFAPYDERDCGNFCPNCGADMRGE